MYIINRIAWDVLIFSIQYDTDYQYSNCLLSFGDLLLITIDIIQHFCATLYRKKKKIGTQPAFVANKVLPNAVKTLLITDKDL